MTKNIFIVGGDGFARECYQYIVNEMQCDKELQFGGFLGHAGYGHTVDYKTWQHLYLGEVSEHIFCDNEYVVIGAAYPDLRKKIYDELKLRNVKFYTIKPQNGVNIKETVEYGEANVFVPGFSPTVNIKIGDGNVFNGDIGIGHDVEIGSFNFFGPRSMLLGNVKVGDNNTIGANVILLPHAKVGNNNKISPLSAVYKGCKNNGYYLGNPAIRIGDVE